ncbi:MAG: HEPN domain-containing protein [Patescibacteria group bacterium]|jgi:HEPN domain-containing protein
MSKDNIRKVMEYWQESAEQDFKIAEYLLKGKKYSASLFFCHLMIEKILKALVVKKTKKHSPYTHKLVNLAKIVNLKLTNEQIDDLTTITEFNIAGRYDEIKFSFYKKCTKEYSDKYFKISKNLYFDFKKQL